MQSIYAIILATGLFFNSALALTGKALQTLDGNFRGGVLILNDFEKGERMEIFDGHACGPSFSPDGQRISYLDVKAKKLVTCALDGSDIKEITDVKDYGTLGVTYWLPDGNIYYNYHNKVVYKVSAEGGTPEEFFKSGKEIHQFGLSNDGKRIAWTQPSYRVMVRDMESGEERTTGSNCQGTMSPDGNFFTRNHGGHKEFSVHNWDDMKVKKSYKCLGGSKHNLHRWAHHEQDYVVYTNEGKGHPGVVHNIETDEATAAGNGTIWDYYEKKPVNLYSNKQFTEDGVLIRPSLDNGLLNVYLPTGDNALSEVLMLNGARVSSQALTGPGWRTVAIPSAKRGVLLVRIKNTQGETVKRINVR